MNYQSKQSLTDRKALRKGIIDLRQRVQADDQIISCYLDTQAGLEACQDFISQQLIHDADSARQPHEPGNHAIVDIIRQAIQHNWNPAAKSLAIFCSYNRQQPQLAVFPLASELPNRISIYHEADLRPLFPLFHPLQNSTVLAYLDKVIQIFDIDLGKFRPVAWAAAPQFFSSSPLTQGQQPVTATSKHLQQVCRSLLGLSTKPLMIAASGPNLSRIKSWLPSGIGWKLQADIVLPYYLGHQGLSDFIQDYFQRQMRLESEHSASRLLNSLRFKGSAVAGPVPSLEALLNHQVYELVISEQPATSIATPCPHCSKLCLNHSTRGRCDHCGQQTERKWYPEIEASWLAFEQNIPVYQDSSYGLLYRGGIGCILKPRENSSQLPVPGAGQQNTIDLVA